MGSEFILTKDVKARLEPREKINHGVFIMSANMYSTIATGDTGFFYLNGPR